MKELEKIELIEKMLEERLGAFKIARDIVRYDSLEKKLIDIRIEDLHWFMGRIQTIKKSENVEEAKSLLKEVIRND